MRRLVLLLSLALLTSCPKSGALGALAKYLPKLTFRRLAVENIDFQKANVNFVFNLQNPDPITVKLASFDYDLGFAGKHLLSGNNRNGAELKASSTTALKIPVQVTFAQLFDTVQATRGKDTIPFEISGHFGFNTPLGMAQVPFDQNGSFPALRTPNFSFQGIRVNKFDLLGGVAALALDLGVENDHASNLAFNNFNYAFDLGGAKVGQGSVASLGTVAGAKTGTLTLPIQVNLAELGQSAVAAIKNHQAVNVGLNATMNVATPFGSVPLTIDKSGQVDIK